jgi:hypothetical protein
MIEENFLACQLYSLAKVGRRCARDSGVVSKKLTSPPTCRHIPLALPLRADWLVSVSASGLCAAHRPEDQRPSRVNAAQAGRFILSHPSAPLSRNNKS